MKKEASMNELSDLTNNPHARMAEEARSSLLVGPQKNPHMQIGRIMVAWHLLPAGYDGADVRAIRLELGLTQDQLASMLGMTRSGVAAYECGQNKVPHPVQWAIEAIRARHAAWLAAHGTEATSP